MMATFCCLILLNGQNTNIPFEKLTQQSPIPAPKSSRNLKAGSENAANLLRPPMEGCEFEICRIFWINLQQTCPLLISSRLQLVWTSLYGTTKARAKKFYSIDPFSRADRLFNLLAQSLAHLSLLGQVDLKREDLLLQRWLGPATIPPSRALR